VNGFSKDNEARLLELLGQELESLQQIRELTLKQADLITADDLTSFEKSLDHRQEFIEKINGLHQESDILMQSYMSFAGSTGGKKNSGIDKLTGRIRELLADCAALNERNISDVKRNNEEHVEQIGKLNKGRKSIGAYAQSIPNKSELFDKKT